MDLAQIRPVLASIHGDQRELIALLRSDTPLDKSVRNFIADELEKEPTRRFRQQSKRDLAVKQRDNEIIWLVRHAKHLMNRNNVSDREALDWLASIGFEISQDDLGNAKRRKSTKK